MATSAPVRMPPEMMSCTSPSMSISSMLRPPGAGPPAWEFPCVRETPAATPRVPPCMPSITTTSAPAFTRQLHVVPRRGRPHLHVDRHLPIGDLRSSSQLDRQVVGTDPIGMPAGGALIDSLGQVPHGGHARTHLLPEQHSAAARLGPLTDDDFDRVGLAEVVRIETVARRQALIDQCLGRSRSSGVMPPSPVVVEVPTRRGRGRALL